MVLKTHEGDFSLNLASQHHQYEYSVRSGQFWTSFDGLNNQKMSKKWEHELSEEIVKVIECVCSEAMLKVGFQLSTNVYEL